MCANAKVYNHPNTKPHKEADVIFKYSVKYVSGVTILVSACPIKPCTVSDIVQHSKAVCMQRQPFGSSSGAGCLLSTPLCPLIILSTCAVPAPGQQPCKQQKQPAAHSCCEYCQNCLSKNVSRRYVGIRSTRLQSAHAALAGLTAGRQTCFCRSSLS